MVLNLTGPPVPRGAAFVEAANTAVTVAMGLVLCFIIAGFIEAFVTPSGLPTAAHVRDWRVRRVVVPRLHRSPRTHRGVARVRRPHVRYPTFVGPRRRPTRFVGIAVCIASHRGFAPLLGSPTTLLNVRWTKHEENSVSTSAMQPASRNPLWFVQDAGPALRWQRLHLDSPVVQAMTRRRRPEDPPKRQP